MNNRFVLYVFYAGTALLLGACANETRVFQKVSPSYSGVHFDNTITENDSVNIFRNIYVFNGGGVAIGDLNNDGLQDIYFTGNQVENRLYLNRGDLRFEDITQASGVQKPRGEWSFGVTMADVNNDGKLDIYVCNAMHRNPAQRKNLLFINQGVDRNKRPLFKELGEEYGLDDSSHSNNAQFFDFDGDGDLDLYIAVSSSLRQYENQFVSTSPSSVQPNTDLLLENVWNDSLQHPVFRDISRSSGVVIGGYSNSTLVTDVNGDNVPDVYVGNDFLSNDIFYVNRRDTNTGRHRLVNEISGIFKHQSYSSMGSDLADVNNDGLLDIITTEMLPYYNKRKKLFLNGNNYTYYFNTEKYGYQYQYMRNTLQINRGRHPQSGLNVYSDCSFFAGVHQTDWSWAPLIADFDNNGFKDIFVSNGFLRDISDHDWGFFRRSIAGASMSMDALTQSIPQVKLPNFVFRNNGELRFENVSRAWGIADPTFSNGSAYADLDNDGDLELIVNNINEKAHIYKNMLRETASGSGKASNYIRIKLGNAPHNIDAVGSAVTVHYGGDKLQTAQVLTSRGYLSQSETILHFGLGEFDSVDSCVVIWPDKSRAVFYAPAINSLNKLLYVDAAPADNPVPPDHPAFVLKSSAAMGIAYRHAEEDFNDFNLQATLPHKLSQYTPPVAVGDLNGDGLDDVFIGGSGGHPDVISYQLEGGKFHTVSIGVCKTGSLLKEEHTSLLIFDVDGDGDNDVYLGHGSYENAADSGLFADRLLINHGNGRFIPSKSTPGGISTMTSAVKAADFDNDGDLDLFIGGRVSPLGYPRAGNSYLLRNDTREHDNPVFTDVTDAWCEQLRTIGMVSDAIWTDFDDDGNMDLIVVGEWMSVVFLKNAGAQLVNISAGTGVAGNTGWWNSISAGDFDNDGDMDYIVGNLGMNTFFNCSDAEPLRIYAHDFDGNGSYDAFISGYGEDSLGVKHEYFYNTRDDMVKQLVLIRKKFNTYGKFGEATVRDVFSDAELANAQVLRANWMYTSYVENLGEGRFAMHALPDEAQYAPVYGTHPVDIDGDGLLDILMVGNDYGMELLQGRADAFYGLVLNNMGSGRFRPLSISKSGFFVPGDAKALSRVDLAKGGELFLASQNRDSLQVLSFFTQLLRTVRVGKGEVSAEITFGDGRRRRAEFPWGDTFVSQGSRSLKWNAYYKKITFYDGRKQITRVLE